MRNKLVLFKLIIILIPLVTASACSFKQQASLIEATTTNQDQYSLNDSDRNQSNEEEKLLNCAYTLKKGIAEITKVLESTIHFIFSPGDIEFQLDSDFLSDKNIIARKNMEFKAAYTIPINNTEECPRPAPELIFD